MWESLRARLKLLAGRGVSKSYSQFGEDAVVGAYLRAKRGFYVDVGAYHPTLYSNTYALYRRGWKGLVIDPNTSLSSLYQALRPRDCFVANAIASTPKTLTYYRYQDGAYNTLSEKRMQELKAKGMPPREESIVHAKPLATIIAEHAISQIDFMNIDVEGLDLEVLESIDWSRAKPSVIAVEDHGFNPAQPEESVVYRYLVTKGYTLRGLGGLTLIFRHA